MNAACSRLGIGRVTFTYWMRRYPAFRARYLRALTVRELSLADAYAQTPTPEIHHAMHQAAKGHARVRTTLANRGLLATKEV